MGDTNNLLVFQDRNKLVRRIKMYLGRAREGIVTGEGNKLEVYSLDQKGLWQVMRGKRENLDIGRSELELLDSEYLQAIAWAIQSPGFYPFWCTNPISNAGDDTHNGDFGYIKLITPRTLGTIVTMNEMNPRFKPKENGEDFKPFPFGRNID